MLGMLSPMLLPFILAPWPASAKDGPAAEAATSIGALGVDDECRVEGGEPCGLNAMQLRRQKLADPTGADAGKVNETGPQGPYEQCGGKDYTGVTECTEGFACVNDTEYFSLCRPKALSEATWKKYNGSSMLDSKSEAPLLTFYVYRAVDMGTYPPTNANVGSSAGILRWLHSEVVSCKYCPNVRPHGIERIARYQVQTRATQPLFIAGMDFGLTLDFEDGLCKGPGDCDDTFAKYGFYVGCKNFSSGIMYSLPGKCTGLKREMKNKECKDEQPGGFCKGVPTGNGTCTWSYAEAGEVSLNELEGITNYTAFKELGGEEYLMATDSGINMTFWNGLNDTKANAARVKKLDALFKEKFPDLPSETELATPACNFDKDKFSPKSPEKA